MAGLTCCCWMSTDGMQSNVTTLVMLDGTSYANVNTNLSSKEQYYLGVIDVALLPSRSAPSIYT
jgi:hypothetical protein